MLDNMAARTGQIMREDKTLVNEGNILAPKPGLNETLTVDGTAAGTKLTPAKYGASTVAYVQVGTAALRYWLSGTPTATEGIELAVGDGVKLQSAEEIAGFIAIRTTGTSSVIQVQYGG